MGEWRDTENERLVHAVEHPVKAVAALEALAHTLNLKIGDALSNYGAEDLVLGLQEAYALLRNMRSDIIREYGVLDNEKGSKE